MGNLSVLVRKAYRFAATGSTRSTSCREYSQYLLGDRRAYDRGLFNLTIDLELGWSRARRNNSCTNLTESLKRSRSARVAFGELLDLTDAYHIPTTFAVVGHLATADCASHRVPPTFRPYWSDEDWFARDPLSNLEQDPDFYGLDLVRRILNSHQDHEIASHGFSHVDLADDTITQEVAAFEISESFRILQHLDSRLATFVFPNNRPAFVGLLKENGFKIYRSDVNGKIGIDPMGLWKFPVGLWLSPLTCGPRDVIELVSIGIRRRHLVNFWCHLHEFEQRGLLNMFFEPVFRFLDSSRREGLLAIDTIRGIIGAYARVHA